MWLICASRNWKLSQSEVLSNDASSSLKMSCSFRYFSHIFAIVNQLPCFSINRLANVEEFFNVNIFWKCKYKCQYKGLFFQIHLCSILLKTSILLPHLFCNVEFEFSWFHISEQSSEILILKIEMPLMFQNKTNIEINGF